MQGRDTTLYSFDNIMRMIAKPIFTYETGLWTVISGTGDFGNNASSNNAEVRNLSQGPQYIFMDCNQRAVQK